MAWTVTTTTTHVDSQQGHAAFHATSDGATDLAGQLIIDISVLTGTPSQIKIDYVTLACELCEGFLSYDHTTDQLIIGCADGDRVEIKASEFLPKGIVDGGSGGTGDVIATTTSGAAGSCMTGFIAWRIP